MRAVAFAFAVVGLLASCGAGRAADEKDLIVGKWAVAYSDAKDIPAGTALEFTKDGKLTLTAKGKDGKEMSLDAGGYKVERDYVTLTGKDGDRNDKARVALLNKTTLVVHDEVEDKVMVMKRMSAK